MKTNYKLTLPILALAATSALYSCSDKDSWYENGLPDPDKELIDFTGTNGGITRAGVITRAAGDGTGSLISLGENTKIAMRIKSEGKNTGDVRYTVTEMKVKDADVTSCSDQLHTSGLGTTNPHDHLEYLDATSYRYWDDAFGRDAKLSVYAIAVPGKSPDNFSNNLKGKTSNGANVVNQETNPNWFTQTTEDETFEWEVNSDNGQTSTTIEDQDICYSNNIRKRNPIDGGDQDNAYPGVYRFNYSNNNWGFLRMEAGRMTWIGQDNKAMAENSTSTAGRFDQGHLIFKHALSKVTINIKEATDTDDKKYGFDNSSSNDFRFTVSGKNVELINFPVKSTFDLASASWLATPTTSTNISFLNETTNSTAAAIQTRTVTGLVIPGKKLWEVNDNAMRFVIDDNDYYVTCHQIAKAIREYYDTGGAGAGHERANDLKSFETMKQGDHYVINITVSKTKIENITAQLIDWEEVNTNDIDPKNSYITVNLNRTGSNVTTVTDGYKFNLYRAGNTDILNPNETGNGDFYNSKLHFNWKTGYTSANTEDATGADTDKATKKYEESKWKTEWFWPDNQTYYHIRAVGNEEGTSNTPSNVSIKKNSSTGDYFKITSGKISENGSSYKDYTWGAPFVQKTSGAKFFYNKNKGFDATSKDDNTTDDSSNPNQNNHQIYKAIGAADPATQNINLMMFHMTSQITLELTTSTDNDRVNLGDGTKVELLNFYKDGTVLVGNGLVKATTTSVQDKDEFKNLPDKHEDYNGTTPTPEKSVFEYGVVPQPLSFTHTPSGGTSTSYKIGIRITTADNNQYVITDLTNVYATVTDNHLNIPYTDQDSNNKYKITEWFPGYKYIYTVKLLKTGIFSITAQLVDWETVKGDLGNITLEGTN